MELLKKSDFYYDLPKELIAQTPLEKRDESRLLVLNKETGELYHKHFYNIIDYLNPGDCLVLNNSKVIPARIYGQKEGTGSKIEFLLLKQINLDVWEVILKPGKKAKIGSKFIFGDGLLKAEVIDIVEEGKRHVKFSYEGNIYDVLDKIGQMPLPPYITEKLKDKDRYQTVYAKDNGSAAAPTAGLHFTNELLQKIKDKGVNICYVTLHVGLGTFRPVKAENIADHIMHTEHYMVSEETAKIISDTKKAGKKVFCCGTTSCRTIEATYKKYGKMVSCEEDTDIFIHPPYQLQGIDCLITNFHLPESTLIMLVCSLAGYDNTMNAYKEAVKNKYRFFSFGDAMLII